MNLCERHIRRSHAGALVGQRRSTAANVFLELVRPAITAARKYRSLDLDCTRAIEAVKHVLAAHRMAAAAPSRSARTSAARQWPGDGAGRQHLVHRHVSTVLRKWIEGRVTVILCGDGCELALGRAKARHVLLSERSVNVHEDAARAAILDTGWRLDAFGETQ